MAKGGRRSGAGRKPVGPMSLAEAVTILRELAAAILGCGDCSRPELARRIFRDAMRAKRRVLKKVGQRDGPGSPHPCPAGP